MVSIKIEKYNLTKPVNMGAFYFQIKLDLNIDELLGQLMNLAESSWLTMFGRTQFIKFYPPLHINKSPYLVQTIILFITCDWQQL